MKKAALFASLILALFASVSCSESKKETKNDTETTTAAETATTEAASTDISAETSTGAAEEVEKFDPAEGTSFKAGKIEGNVYTSEYAGIKFTLPDGVEFMDMKELEEMVQQSISMLEGDDKKQLMAKITEAEIFEPDTMTIVDIGFHNIKYLHPDHADMTAGEFIEEDVVAPVRQLDVNITEPETVKLGGREFTKVKISEKENEGTYQNLYASRVDDDFIMFITAFPGKIGDEAKFESCFEALN